MVQNDIKACKISFSFKFGKVRIYQKNITELHEPKYVQLLLSPVEKALYLVGIDQREKDCFPVPSDEERRANGFVLNGQSFVRRIGKMLDWDINRTHVIAGVPDAERRTVVYDLHNEVRETE